jgi:hypothetical protein
VTTGTRFLTREETEAECRKLMAERAALRVTHLTRKRHAELWVKIHEKLDDYLEDARG